MDIDFLNFIFRDELEWVSLVFKFNNRHWMISGICFADWYDWNTCLPQEENKPKVRIKRKVLVISMFNLFIKMINLGTLRSKI